MNSFYALLITLFFSLTAFSQNFVVVNQVGYKPGQEKKVLCNFSCDSFTVLQNETNEIVFSGDMNKRIEKDPATGMIVFEGNFTGFTKEGEYYVSIGEQKSYPFVISNNVFNVAYKTSLKGFYFLRCGTELPEEFAGEFIHEACHLDDGYYHQSTYLEGKKETTGGWHDAGDYGKYIVNAAISVGELMMAYEHFPEYFNQDDLIIPESGNDIPDILDEIRYELEWMLKMQHSDGGVFHKITSENFSGFIMPENHTDKRYLMEISSTATADFAAVMAMASRIYKEFDNQFSEKCLKAALFSWEYLVNNPEIMPEKGFHNAETVNTGQYGDSDDRDERLWAASELYVTTNEETFLFYYKEHFEEKPLFESEMAWPNVDALAHLSMLKHEATDKENQEKLKDALLSFCDEVVEKYEISGFFAAMNPIEYVWGSNSVILNKTILLINAYELTGEEKYLQATFHQLDHILGMNGLQICFIPGVGINYPRNLHYRPGAADNIDEPVPGLIAGGPNLHRQDEDMKKMLDNSVPPALCYLDVTGSYASNEICINWNAPLVYVLGYFNGKEVSFSK